MANVNWRNQLALALALFLLGSAAYWLEFRHKPETESKEEQSKKLFQLKDTPVHRIRMAAGKKLIELKCADAAGKLCKPGDNAKWEISDPMKVAADDAAANSLVSTLNNLSSTDSIGLEEETEKKREALLKEYGLDLAALESGSARSIQVETPEERLTLFIGNTHPINDNFFGIRAVQKLDDADSAIKAVDRNHVLLVPSHLKTNFERELTYWRDKKLLTFSSHDIASFILNSQKGGKIAAAKNESQWQLNVAGQSYPGDIENIDSLLSSAAQLTAKEFAADDKNSIPAKRALRGSRRVLSFEVVRKAPEKSDKSDSSAAPVTLTMFRHTKSGKLFATVSSLDPLFELEPAAFNRLNKDLKDLRLVKLITSLDRFTAKRLEVSGAAIGEKAIVLTQDAGKWMLAPEKKEVDAEKVQRLLDRLTGNRIKDFLPAAKAPAIKDGLQIALGDEKKDVKRQILFWKKGGKLYGKDLLSTRRGEVFLIDSILMDELPWNRAFFDKADPTASPSAVPGSN